MVTAPRPPTSGYSFWVDVTVLEPDQRGGGALALITQVVQAGLEIRCTGHCHGAEAGLLQRSFPWMSRAGSVLWLERWKPGVGRKGRGPG